MGVVITRTANPSGVTAVSNVATYTAAAIGTAASNRIVVVNVTSEVASATINSCTIGGTSMTAGTAGTQGNARTRQFYLVYPTGTTADILVTFGASPTNTQNHISVYTVTDGAFTSTGANNSTDMDATAPLTTGSQTIGTGGGMIAVVCGATDTVAKTWSVAGEDLDADVGSHRHTTWFSTTAATQTLTCTGGTDGEDGAMSWLIFANNTEPTVALNSPADAANTGDLTPTLNFTGTDTDSDAVEYEVQVATSTFSNVSIANLTSGNEQDGDSTATTSSISPSSNKLLLLSVVQRTGITVDPNEPTATGNGLTWVVINSIVYDTTSSSRKRITLFRAMGSSPSSGAVSIDCGGQAQTDIFWSVEEVTGMDTSGTNGSGAVVQSVTNKEDAGDGGLLTVTLGAFSNVNNATFGTFTGDTGSGVAITVGSGFTILAEQHPVGLQETLTEWRVDNDTTVDATMSSTAGACTGGIAIEIKAANQILIDALSTTDVGFVGTAGGNNVTATNLTTGSSNANGPWNTSSVTPTANKLQLLSIYLRNGSSVNPSVSTVTGNGLTWVLAQSINFDTASTSRRTLEVWRAMGSSPSTGAITITPTETETGAIWSLEEVTGVDTSGTNGSGAIVQSATNKDEAPASGAITATLSAFSSSNNATFGFFANDIGGDTTTAGTGFTKLGDVGSADANISSRVTSEYKNSNDTSVDITFSSTPGVMGVIALEIKAGHPYPSASATDYTIQSDLTASTVYYWRVRAIDPSGSNNWGAWATTRSFVATAGGTTIRRYSLTTLGVG